MHVRFGKGLGAAAAVALGAAAAAGGADGGGLAGFSGQVRGIVGARQGDGFEFKVARVVKVWQGNKAADPQALAGQTIRVLPRTAGTEGGKPAAPIHAAFLQTLREGEEITLDVRSEDGTTFRLTELDAAQRARAGVAPPTGGGDDAPRILQLERELKALREENAKLRERLNAGPR